MTQSHVERFDSTRAFSCGAPAYRKGIAAFTRITAERLADLARIGPADRVLDLGTGPGVVPAVAIARGAWCLGVDNARGMLREARKTVPTSRWVQSSGQLLPFRHDTADVVTAAYAFGCVAPGGRLSTRLLLVLRPGGRLAFSNWVPEGSANIQILNEALELHGDPDAPPPPGYPPWLFPSLESYRELVRSPGLRDGHAEIVAHDWVLHSPYDLFDSLVEINPRLRGHSVSHLARIRETTADLVLRYQQSERIRLPMEIAYGWAYAL